jgi:trehalose 6-phosphate synthase
MNEDAIRQAIAKSEEESGFSFEPIFLSKEEVDGYYFGFSNEIIWPLFHDLQGRCKFTPEYWHTYQKVNAKFAKALVDKVQAKERFFWIHDYHLMLLGKMLRERGIRDRMGFFLHIPFPPLDLFTKLPWRYQILQALLAYDLVGFQTHRDRRNFIQCVRHMRAHIRIHSAKDVHICTWDNHETRLGAFPISIDYKEFADQAASPQIAEAAWLLHEKWPNQQIVLSIDRLDYTKGIVLRLQGISKFLEMHPEQHGKVCFVQFVVPSRTDIQSYQTQKDEIERLVGQINGTFTQQNWVPVQHHFQSLPRNELLAYYRTANVLLATPIKDGMNLVAKEYVACQADQDGVLILSEFAGAATQLQNGALLVNPYDVEGMAAKIHEALTMDAKERRRRTSLLQRSVKRLDIFWWMDTFLQTAFAKSLHDFPVSQEGSIPTPIPSDGYVRK